MNKRTVMTLYSGDDIYSHQVRIVLAEKGVNVDVLNISQEHTNEDLIQLNPYNTLPTLVDRDLVIYNARIIMEYLDERFPHPPLLPVYPVSRSKSRLMMFRIKQDWYKLVDRILTPGVDSDIKQAAQEELRSGLVALTPLFSDKPFFLSEDFTLVDCLIAPMLWRLSVLGIELPKQAKPILDYAQRIFERDSFQASLTENELDMKRDLHEV